MGLGIRERVNKGPGGRRHGTVQHRRIEIKKRPKESCAIVQRRRRPLDQTNLECNACVGQQPCVAPQQNRQGRQVTVVQRAHNVLFDKCLPGPRRIGVGRTSGLFSVK